MRFIVLTFFIGLFATACGSGSGNTNSSDGPNPPGNFRVATLTVDFNADGTPDQTTEFDYDDTGRIVIITTTDLRSLRDPELISYSYGPSGIETRVEGFSTQTFTYESGLLTQITDTDSLSDLLTYTYDSAGRLSSVVGDVFFRDDDCNAPGPDFFEVPVYQLSYTGGRISSITGSFGDVTNLEYNTQGRLSTLRSTGECAGEGSTTVSFGYDSNGRAVSASTEYISDEFGFDNSTEELVASYANGRLSNVTTTFNDSFGIESTALSFSYDARGLLTSSTVTAENNFIGNVGLSTTRLSYTYEEGRCESQQTAYPHAAIFLGIQPSFQTADAALACAYTLDNF